MSYRLIALDMDGTVLDSRHALTPRTIGALIDAGHAGARVVLASGRMPCALGPFIEKLHITAPLICYNGALVARDAKGEALGAFPIEAALAREACAACEAMGLHVQAYHEDAFYCARDNAFGRDYKAFLNCPVKMNVTGEDMSAWLTFDTPKLLAIDTPDRIQAALPVLRERFAGRLKIATSQPRFIEFVSPRAGKAAALEKLCALEGVRREEVIAFGDGLNDLDMLKWAGTACAMKNAVAEVKAAADSVAPSNDQDGVAQIVQGLITAGMIGGGARG